jgi:beta-aspartyl-dipeptidase (metallo-type)
MDIGRPQSLVLTLAQLLAAGMTLDSVLPAFTSNVADILRLRDRGRICPGASADLVVLDDSHAVNDVMVSGAWHVRNGEQRVFGQFENNDHK